MVKGMLMSDIGHLLDVDFYCTVETVAVGANFTDDLLVAVNTNVGFHGFLSVWLVAMSLR